MYYPRQIESILQKAARRFRVVVLTGARQTGKSTLLKHLFRRTHRYVSLDNPRDLKLAQEDPVLFFREYSGPLILDEIQLSPELLPYVKMRVYAGACKGQFLIIGSQQFTLMKNLRESLAGRAALFYLFPMSVLEGGISRRTYEFRGLKGSYPELVVSRSLDPERWFASYVSTYIEKDVQTQYRLEKITHFRDLSFLLAARISQTLNYQTLANDLGVSVHAVKLWIKVLEASQIVYLLKPYYLNLGSRIVKAPKVYFTDIGLVSYLTGVQDKKTLLRGALAGPMFENFIIQEILKKYANLGKIPAPLFYYRTNNGLEIDLIIEKKAGVIQPCEIKSNQSPHPGMVRAIERFQALNKNRIHCLDGCLIAPIARSIPLTRTIRVFNLKEFLRQPV